jgi:LPXTG-motif cell wall-anchored protein
VLSANYFKDMIGICYGKEANFYTIGLGVTDTYSTAVLDPTAANLSALINDSTAETYYDLYSLLTKNTTNLLLRKVGLTTQKATTSLSGSSHRFLTATALGNPYADDYSYANESFCDNMTAETLTENLNKIIEEVELKDTHGFLLAEDTNLEINDPLGDGMEVKGAPVLRYAGQNYMPTYYDSNLVDDEYGIYTEYTYTPTETITRENSNTSKSDEQLEISTITVKVYETGSDGTGGRVILTVPADVMPVYYPELYETFYYQELPVRLIYRVGLTDDTILNLKKELNENPDELDFSYYTNAWSEDEPDIINTTVSFKPALPDEEDDEGSEILPDTYYTDYVYDTEYGDGVYADYKTKNTTRTAYDNDEDIESSGIRFYEDYEEDNVDQPTVCQYLGNNGKITLSRDAIQAITVSKLWPNGVPSSTNSVNFDFYYQTSNGSYTKLTSLNIASSSSQSGTQTPTWKSSVAVGNYPTSAKAFYVCETNAPDGFETTYMQGTTKLEPTTITVNGQTLTAYEFSFDELESADLTVTNSQAYTLPAAGGTGTYMYTLGGVALVLLSTYALYMLVKRREKTPAKGVKNGDFYW